MSTKLCTSADLNELKTLARTIRGRVSFMEDDNNWHYRVPTADEVQAARSELGLT